jgi:plasmid maintenance system antidote protein VapI
VPARDRRTVGELLADSDALSREMLLDVSAKQGPAMVRTWGQVVQSAARLWAVLPPISVAAPSGPDLMVRLRVIGDGIARSTSAGGWPGLEPMDERLLEIARNLSRAADLVERYGQDVQPTSAETRADITAARARVMHTLYVLLTVRLSHSGSTRTTSAIGCIWTLKGAGPSGCGPLFARERQLRQCSPASESSRQVAAGYVAAHPVTASVLGKVRPTPPTTRLQSALSAWDIQVHRTLAARTDAADLVRLGRVQALIASAAAIVTEAAGEKAEIDPEMVRRLTVTLDASQVAWSRMAKRWGELTDQDSRPDPALARAASEVRAAISATACNPTGWATPRSLAESI